METIPFHEQLRYERERRGWSQADLAEKVGCDTKTVSRWESGERFPRPYHRQAFCELFGKNAEELGLLNKRTKNIRVSSSHTTSRQLPRASHTPGDPDASLPLIPGTTPSDQLTFKEAQASSHTTPMRFQEDWGEVPYVVSMYGRDEECSELEQWIGDRRCRVVVVLGMGGVGKTAIAAWVAEQVKRSFEYVFWRSLHNAPSLEHILSECIRFISDQQRLDLPGELDDQISLLIQYLRNNRCLLVLDNFESILQAGQRAGQYREGYAAYSRLLQRVGETQHQSCLLLTGREKPKEVAHFEGKISPVRSIHLSGLRWSAVRELLLDKGLIGSDEHWATLVDRYSGNPLALQVVCEYIQELFGGTIANFLEEEAIAFGDINDLLEQQFHRLSAREREIMFWLTIEREAVPLEDLNENLVHPISKGALLEALDSLRRRSLIETRGSAQFTLQPVIMEYVTASLINRANREFDTEAPGVWMNFALTKAQAKDYVRESQVRIILGPVAQHLLARIGKEGIERKVGDKLTRQRQVHAQQPGYLAGNILNLLSYLRCDLRGLDFSHLVVRQAYLQGVLLPEANFARARFVASIFNNTFGSILAVACSLDGNSLAAGTAAGEIWIYDAFSGVPRPRFICRGHTDGVWSLAFSPDGGLLASSSDDQAVRLWDSFSGDCLEILQGHTSRVRALAFSPGESILATGSDDQTIRLWDIKTGDCLTTLHGHTGRIWSVAFSPDGKLLASGSTDQTVRIWNTSTGECLRTQRDHGDWVRSVAFHPKESILASGSDDQTIRLWDVSTGDCLKTLRGHTDRVWSVAFHPAGGIVASSSEDQTIRLWNIHTGRCLMSLQGHTQGVRTVAFAPNGYTLFSGGDDQTIRLWDVANGHCLQTVQGYTNRVWSIDFSTDGSILASGSEDSIIRLWDVKTGQCLKMLQNSSHGVLVVAFSPGGFRLASGGQDQTIRVWDGNTGRSLSTLRGHTNWVRTVISSPDGHTLASGSEDQAIRLWDINTGSCIRLLQGHTSWVRSVAFSPDGNMLASGADDHMINLWDVTDGRCLRTLQGHTNRVRSVVFSHDGNMLASGSEDQTIRLWDVRTGHCFNTLQGHSGWIRSVAFSPDGNILASSGEDQTVLLWDVNTWQCFQTLHGHSNRVRRVTFSPDGHTLASSSDDGTVKLWDIQTAACLKTFISERPYERMNITHVQGLTEAQKANLVALGAIEES